MARLEGRTSCVVVLLLLSATSVFVPVAIEEAVAQVRGADSDTFAVPDIERIRVRDELQKHVSDVVEKAILVSGLQDKRSPIVRLNLTIDKERVARDFATHQQKQAALEKQQNSQLWQDSTSRFIEMMKLMNAGEEASSPADDSKPSNNEQPAPRFGILNVDPASISQQNASKPSASERRALPSISFSGPAMTFQKVQFTYSLLDYIADISISIHVPSKFSKEARNELQKDIVSLLNLGILTNENANEKIKIIDIAAPADSSELSDDKKGAESAQKESWLQEFLNPKNQSLSGLFVSLAGLFGFFLIGMTVLLSGRKLATAVTGLAQAASQAKESNGGQQEDVASTASPVAVEVAAAPQEKSSRSKFSADKEADLLAQTRNQITENLKDWCQRDPVTVGEVLIDLSTGPNGLATINSLLVYSGYANLKPALELLPNSLLRKLDESLNESWQDGAELLPGLEAAQLLLAGMIPRQTALLRFSYDTVPIRKLLLKLEPSALKELSLELTNEEFGIIFKILPRSVALSVTHSIAPDKLKEVLDSLSDSSTDRGPDESLLKKIEARRDATTDQRNSDKERLIRGMLKTATPANESKILEFIGPGDLLMRYELLQERFFLYDLKFVEPTLLRSILDKENLARKANFLYFSDPSLRQGVLDLYPKESKALEALLEELDNIEKSPKRKTAAEADKFSVRANVSGKLSERCKSDLIFRISIIRKISESMGAQLPAEILQLAESQSESAA